MELKVLFAIVLFCGSAKAGTMRQDDADKIQVIAMPQKKPATTMYTPTYTPMQTVQMMPVNPVKIPQAPELPAQPSDSPADMCAGKINEEMKVIEETLTRCAEEGHSTAAFDYCVVGICGTQFTASYTVCQQARFWRMARDCDTRVCIVDLRKFWLTTPNPNGYQLPTGNGNGNWRWVPFGSE